MANIPTIPGTAQVESPELGVQVNPRSRLMAIGQAAETIGEGLSVISDYEQRKQKAEEVAGFNQTSIVLNKATSDYQHGLATMDDKEIVPKWEEIALKTKDEVMKNTAGWTPAAKNKLSQTLDTWASDSTIQFQVASDHLGSQRRKATAVAASQEFLQTGDKEMLPNAMNALKAAKDAGDMTEAEYNERTQGLTRGLEENQIRIGMTSDPQSTLKAMDSGEFKDVPPKSLHTLRGQVVKAISDQQNATRDDFTKRVDSHDIVSDEELDGAEQSGKISPLGARALRNYRDGKNLKEAKDTSAILKTDVREFDFEQSEHPDLAAQHFKDAAASLPPVLRAQVFDVVDNKLNAAKKKGVSAEHPVQTEILAQGKKDLNEGMFDAPGKADVTMDVPRFVPLPFGVAQLGSKEMKVGEEAVKPTRNKKFMGTATEPGAPEEAISAARVRHAQWEDKVVSYIKTLKPDDPKMREKVQAFSDDLMKPHIEAQVNESLAPTAKTNLSKEEYAKLPKGAKFTFDGKEYTKE